jgi:hypothetical protein
MRIGPALWDRFTESIEADDFNYKHHVYSELAALPVREFNVKMREIMAGTQEGKNIVKNIIDEVKSSIQEEEYHESMSETQTEDGFTFDDLIKGEDNDDNLTDDGFDFDELF